MILNFHIHISTFSTYFICYDFAMYKHIFEDDEFCSFMRDEEKMFNDVCHANTVS